jgi:hypothetical protein
LKGFLEDVEHSCLFAHFNVFAAGEGCQPDDGNRQDLVIVDHRNDPFGRFQPIQYGHLVVHYYELVLHTMLTAWRFPEDHFDGLLSMVGYMHFKLEAAEHKGECRLVENFIVYGEDGCALTPFLMVFR